MYSKKFFFILTIVLVSGFLSKSNILASEKLRIVATLPHDAALVRTVGGEYVQVDSLTRGEEDPHGVTARFSVIPLLNRADLLIVNGQQLEVMWLPELLQKSRNNKILPGNEGYLNISKGVDLIFYDPKEIGRSRLFDANFAYGAKTGQIGNHHYWLDPANGRIATKNIFEKLKELDPGHESAYRMNYERFVSELQKKIEDWDRQIALYKGFQVVSYHRSWNYLLRRYDIRVLGYIEPLELGSPNPNHMKKLARQMKEQKVQLILMESYQDKKVAEQLAQEAGARLVILPSSVGAEPGIQSYIQLLDVIYGRLVEVLAEVQKHRGARVPEYGNNTKSPRVSMLLCPRVS